MLNPLSAVSIIVHHFTLNLLENMANRFQHIPDFAWISHALPLKTTSPGSHLLINGLQVWGK